jgi:catechol 2,3-dioxygenase-like lactoylglutathione lyase family enzyme
MKVKRIVANVKAENVGDAKRFYEKVLGLEQLMNLGWIATYGSNAKSIVQMSFMKEGGSGTAVPDISIEVDNVDDAYKRMKEGKFKIEYGITDEPWGVRREYSFPHEGENRDILNFAARGGPANPSALSPTHYLNPKLLPPSLIPRFKCMSSNSQ